MSDAYQTIRLQRRGAVALLTLARPQRLNAIDKRMLGELQLSLDEVERDEEIRRPTRIIIRVVLPHPLGPSNETNSPLPMPNETSLKA